MGKITVYPLTNLRTETGIPVLTINNNEDLEFCGAEIKRHALHGSKVGCLVRKYHYNKGKVPIIVLVKAKAPVVYARSKSTSEIVPSSAKYPSIKVDESDIYWDIDDIPRGKHKT